MANTTLTADIIAKEAVMILENNLTMGNLVFRGYEPEFDKNINGYKVGETVSIRRPADFTVRSGKVVDVQDVTEGKIPVTVDLQKGIDFKFSSQDLTLQIGPLSERVIKPAMIQLANQIDLDLMALYSEVPKHVIIPSGGIDSFADFALAPTLMDTTSIPQEGRKAVLSPADHWALLGSQTGLFIQDAARGAYRQGSLGMIGGVETFMSQNVPTHTTGARTGTDTADLAVVDGYYSWGAGGTVANVKDATHVTFHIDGAASDDTVYWAKGDIFTISDVFDVNPVSKTTLAHLKQFVVMEDGATSGSEGDVEIWPPIVLSGAHKTAHLATGDIDGNTITYFGTASTGFTQNLFFHKNAFALTMVPMVKPPGAMDVSRRSYKGVSVRVIPFYDGTNDDSTWRLDCLYGVDTVDSRLAVRASLMDTVV